MSLADYLDATFAARRIPTEAADDRGRGGPGRGTAWDRLVASFDRAPRTPNPIPTDPPVVESMIEALAIGSTRAFFWQLPSR